MDFVQHDIADIATRFFGYLVFILAYSTGIHGGVRAAFEVFNLDLKNTWWDEVAIAVLGIFFALAIDLNLFFYIAGITNTQYAMSVSVRAADMSPSALFPVGLVITVCNVVTGAMVVGGRKAVVGIAEEFKQGLEAIKAIRDR